MANPSLSGKKLPRKWDVNKFWFIHLVEESCHMCVCVCVCIAALDDMNSYKHCVFFMICRMNNVYFPVVTEYFVFDVLGFIVSLCICMEYLGCSEAPRKRYRRRWREEKKISTLPNAQFIQYWTLMCVAIETLDIHKSSFWFQQLVACR